MFQHVEKNGRILMAAVTAVLTFIIRVSIHLDLTVGLRPIKDDVAASYWPIDFSLFCFLLFIIINNLNDSLSLTDGAIFRCANFQLQMEANQEAKSAGQAMGKQGGPSTLYGR